MGKDVVQVEFELGDLEFEAKGNADVIERIFKHLLKMIEEERIPINRPEEDEAEIEEEDYESEADLESEPVSEETEAVKEELDHYADDTLKPPPEEIIEPPPEWDSLDEASPPESEVERRIDSEEY